MVRLKPTRAQVQQAERLYAQLAAQRRGGRHTVKLHAGKVHRLGWRDLPARLHRMTLTQRMGLGVSALLAASPSLPPRCGRWRSATAAKEVRDVIGASAEQVGEGVRRVKDAGGTIGEVVGTVRHVTTLAQHIRHTAEEQSGGVSQINEAVAHIDSATQQNAAMVEQTAAACEALQLRAGTLVRSVQVFRMAA